MEKESLQLVLSRFDRLEDKIDEKLASQASRFEDSLKSVTDEMKTVKKDVWALKTRFAVIAVSLGVAGGKLAEFLPFLK